MTNARLRVIDARERTVDDPTQSQVYELLAGMNSQHPFVILERLDREPVDEHYIQVYLHRDSSYQLEYREGSAQRHFQATLPARPSGGTEPLVDIMMDWSRDGTKWRDACAWARLEL